MLGWLNLLVVAACSSSVKNESLDYPLLVANSSYAYTANECVKCKCDSSNNYMWVPPFVFHILCYYFNLCSVGIIIYTCDVICYVDFVFRLQCEQSELKPTNWSICPSAQCSSNVFIGNITSHTDPCNRTICAYTGYTFRNISAELVTQNTCAG